MCVCLYNNPRFNRYLEKPENDAEATKYHQKMPKEKVA